MKIEISLFRKGCFCISRHIFKLHHNALYFATVIYSIICIHDIYMYYVLTYLPHNLSYLCHCYIYPMSLLNWLPSPYYAIKCEVSKNIGQPHFNPFVGWALKQALVMNRIFTHEWYTSKVFNQILFEIIFFFCGST